MSERRYSAGKPLPASMGGRKICREIPFDPAGLCSLAQRDNKIGALMIKEPSKYAVSERVPSKVVEALETTKLYGAKCPFETLRDPLT